MLPDPNKMMQSAESNFHPAKLWKWLLRIFQSYIRIDLALHNQVHIDKSDLRILKNLPSGMGVILTPNHADETDFKVCVELSRITGRNFFYMMNSEAFYEGYGLSGWWLQRLGAFSVERGGAGNLEQSKRYAIDVVKHARDMLVIFPEGEIYYLNDLVQPLKSGAVDVGMKAVLEARQVCQDWTAYLVPMAIKYRYSRSIGAILEKHIEKIEKRLDRRARTHNLGMRVALLVAELLRRQELMHNFKSGSARLTDLSKRVKDVRQSIIRQIEEKYPDALAIPQQNRLLDRCWQLRSYLQSLPRGIFCKESFAQMRKDLVELTRVAQMESWQLEYMELNPSQERLAEMVLKLDREVYNSKRPRQLAKRQVFVRIGQPIDLAPYIAEYQQDAHAVRHRVAEKLRDTLQYLIDSTGPVDSLPPILWDI